MANRFILALAAAVLLTPPLIPVCRAQMHGGVRLTIGGSVRHGASSYGHRRQGVPFEYFLGDAPYLYGDYPYDQTVAESTPQVVMMPPPLPTADIPSQPKPGPVLIELEGDHYVRYGGGTQATENDAMHAGRFREPGDPAAKRTRLLLLNWCPPSSYTATAAARKFPTMPSSAAFSMHIATASLSLLTA